MSEASVSELAYLRGEESEAESSELARQLGAMTIGQAVHRAAQLWGDRNLLVFPERRLSARELERESSRLARGLLRLGMQRGQHVAVLLPNCLEYCVTELALARIGAAMVPVNIRYKAGELEFVLRQSDADAFLFCPRFQRQSFLEMLDEICPERTQAPDSSFRSERLSRLKLVITVAERVPGLLAYEDVLRAGDEASPGDELSQCEASVKPEDVVLLQYTSGSTAFPKAAMLAHGAVLRNAFQMAERAGIGSEDRVLSAMPMFHVGGSVCAFLGAITRGYTLYTGAHLDAAETLRIIEQEAITTYIGLEPMFIAIRNQPEFEQRSRSSLCKGWSAGTSSILRMVAEEIGIRNICSLYGLSECSPNVTISHWEDPYEKRIKTMGRPQPGVEVKIVDLHTGHTLKRGERGEICVRGYGVMRGYYNNPEETAKAIDSEGWLHTGDLGFIDEDGFLTWTGRWKDMLRVGGENVSALEVENLLCSHPQIQAAAVVGVPSAKWGEVPLAFVKLRPNEKVSESEIIHYCRERVAVFKVPHYVRFVDEFEMTGSGKIQKYLMRERAIKELNL